MSLRPGLLDFKELEGSLGSFKLAVPSSIVEELKILSAKKGARSMKAKLALKIITEKKFEIIEDDAKYADTSLINIADRNDVIIATLDKEIISRVKRKGRKVVTLRDERLVVI